jgi:DNA polymerase epsilon subunit 1
VVSRETCASCDYNDDKNNCKRPLDWIWRGELNPAKAAEFAQLRRQLQYERVADVPYHDLPQKRQAELLRLRARDYSQKVYKKTKVSTEEHRTDVTCMRENSFYIDTARNAASPRNPRPENSRL